MKTLRTHTKCGMLQNGKCCKMWNIGKSEISQNGKYHKIWNAKKMWKVKNVKCEKCEM